MLHADAHLSQLALISTRPCVSVCHGLTLCGAKLRLWRFDAHTYACTRVIDLHDEAHVEQLVRLVAFLASDEALVRWSPTEHETFGVKNGLDSVEVYTWLAPPVLLLARCDLFGGRTCCWGGQARRSGGEVEDIVIKMAWVPSYLIGHEGAVLRHLEAAEVSNIPRFAGTLDYPSAMRTDRSNHAVKLIDDAAISKARCWIPEWSKHGVELDALVLKCPIGLRIVARSPRAQLDVLHMYRDLGAVLARVAEANVHYRDFNLGNVLLAPASLRESSGLAVLLIDFGGARIGEQPRGNLPSRDRSASVADGGHELRLSADDACSANASFISRQSTQAAENVREVIEWSEKVALFEADLPAPSADDYDYKNTDLQLARQTLSEAEAAVRSSQHRPTDDLESAFWCLLYQVRRNARFPAAPARFCPSLWRQDLGS